MKEITSFTKMIDDNNEDGEDEDEFVGEHETEYYNGTNEIMKIFKENVLFFFKS